MAETSKERASLIAVCDRSKSKDYFHSHLLPAAMMPYCWPARRFYAGIAPLYYTTLNNYTLILKLQNANPVK